MKLNTHSNKKHEALILCLFLLNAGCASTAGNLNDRDPYETFNRPVHQFNSKVDAYVAKPISDAYKWITPTFLQTGVNNFFNNLQDVNVIINDLLQAKFKQGAQDLGRLTLNSTVGLGGVIDVASQAGLDKHNEDFGQTLAVWGLPQGAYLVLPFIGPSTFRELPGYIVDTATNPGSYVTGFALPLAGASLLNSRANAEGSLQFINEAALDPYIFMRESFLQWRNFQATDGKVKPDQALEDLEAELFEDDENATPGSQEKASPTPTRLQPKQATLSYEEAKHLFNKASSRLDASKAK